MCKLSLYKMNGYIWCKYFLCKHIIKFDWKKLKENLKYIFVITYMFNTPNCYLYVNWILVYNLVLDLFWILGFHYFSSFRCAIGTSLLSLLSFPIILNFYLFTLFFNHEPMSSSFSISFIFSCLSLTFI
jgi:hypothetical protein